MSVKQYPEASTADTHANQHFDAVVVGAGFAGLYMLYRLRRLGLSVRVVETGGGIGGTWYWNRYPGARCDSESYYYSFSFSEELQQEWHWSERYPGQPEIMRYLNYVADKFDLRRDIQLNTRVAAASFDDATACWTIATARGQRLKARYFITGVGCLSAANIPQIEGLERFTGAWYHTGRWPHAGVDFSGQRVGVVGTGSTGIQAIPVIAAQAAHLTVFQRTANYSIPARNGTVTRQEEARQKADYESIRRKQRETGNCHPFDISEQSALEISPAERQARYEAAWQRGSLRFRATFKDLLTSEQANATASDFIRAKIRATVADPETADKLVPNDHPFATKRPPIDTDYFETYNRGNVSLVDVKRSPITACTPTGLQTAHAHYALDVLVFATGFDAMTGALLNIDIRGAGGQRLSDQWSAGPHNYLGLQIADFPNLFTITGPGSPSVLTNMPTSIEQHVDWIADCIDYMRARGLGSIEAKRQAQANWVRHVNEVAHRTLLPRAHSSWYLGANVPGKPRVFMPYAGGAATYRRICDDVAANDYEGFALAGSPVTEETLG